MIREILLNMYRLKGGEFTVFPFSFFGLLLKPTILVSMCLFFFLFLLVLFGFPPS